MKKKISKLVILLAIIQLVIGCSTFDDALTYNTPPSPNDVQARVISGDLKGRKFTVIVDGMVIATNATYGKFTPYATVPFGAKKYYFVDEATKDTIKFDITKLALDECSDQLLNGMVKGLRYSLMIKHPANEKSGIFKDNFALVAREEGTSSLKKGYFALKNLALYETKDSRRAIHLPGFVYNDDQIYDNQHNDGRNPHWRYGFYPRDGFNCSIEGKYSEFKMDTKFNYYFLDNRGNRKLFSFEGVNFIEGGLYTIVAYGKLDENPDSPLEVVVYHDNGLPGEEPVKLKRLPDDLRPIKSQIFNLAYGLASYGYLESPFSSFTRGNTGDYKGISVTANLPSRSIELAKGVLYPSGNPMFNLTKDLEQNLKTNLNYSINPVLNTTTLTSPELGSFDYTALNVPSQNFYVATTSAGTTTLIALPNPEVPKGAPYARVVNMVPDAAVKVELTAPDGTTITIADGLAFGQQSPYIKLDGLPLTEFDTDEFGTSVPKSGYKIKISDTSGNNYCFGEYQLTETTNTLLLSGTANPGDDEVTDALGNITNFARLSLLIYSDITSSVSTEFPITAVSCD